MVSAFLVDDEINLVNICHYLNKIDSNFKFAQADGAKLQSARPDYPNKVKVSSFPFHQL